MSCRFDHDEIYCIECLLAKCQELWHRQTFSKPTKKRTEEIIATLESAKENIDQIIAGLTLELQPPIKDKP